MSTKYVTPSPELDSENSDEAFEIIEKSNESLCSVSVENYLSLPEVEFLFDSEFIFSKYFYYRFFPYVNLFFIGNFSIIFQT